MPCTTQSKPVDFLWISPAFFMNKLWISSGKVSSFRLETTMGRALLADVANALPNSLDNYFPNAFARNAVTRAMASSLASGWVPVIGTTWVRGLANSGRLRTGRLG
ncbi:hypothetical protein PCO31110_00909 [Pandoraea communis]|uniref:Uncharacterized protein n=1 Tax=Pandoraea communis TaxID=2508297 RepID=A0A5E4SLW1_9BURK|nr:hypothetical protein PCO31110_00909 [Pandoraea communis]